MYRSGQWRNIATDKSKWKPIFIESLQKVSLTMHNFQKYIVDIYIYIYQWLIEIKNDGYQRIFIVSGVHYHVINTKPEFWLEINQIGNLFLWTVCKQFQNFQKHIVLKWLIEIKNYRYFDCPFSYTGQQSKIRIKINRMSNL